MAESYIVTEPGVGRLEVFRLDTSQEALLALLTDVFENHWRDVAFGPLVQGAVFEIRAPNAPQRISLLDGYLTVNFGAWHFHLCIGEHKGPGRDPTPFDVAGHRRCKRAEMLRILGPGGAPSSWQMRFLNGRDEQMMTVFFPHPYITREDKIRKQPDWSQLAMWDKFRKTYLGLDPDPLDRAGEGMAFGGH
jgi:hypothetical protein